jgi:signal transduction histidine kinase
MANAAADRLLANKERIIELWVERLRDAVGPAKTAWEPLLINTVPAYLRRMSEALSADHPRTTASDGSTIPVEHGGERARVTAFGPGDLVYEYQILRDAIVEVVGEEVPLTPEETGVIVRSIDIAIRESCTSFFEALIGIREQFTLGLTHDLRSPLTAAKAGASLILRRGDDPDVLKWAARILDNVERIDRMIRDLLDASRVRAGERLPLEVAEVELVSLVKDTVEHLETIHGGRFRIVSTGPIVGYWSADAFRRAIENLVGNALKYGSQDDPVTITARETHGRAIVTVHNHGSYIPVEEQETIFQSFRRRAEREQRGTKGWGVGLALVRGVAESHGGSIVIDSLPESGTTFTIDVPVDARPFIG